MMSGQWPQKAGQGAWPTSTSWCRLCLPDRLRTEMSSYLLPGPLSQPLCFLLNFRLGALTQDQPPCFSSKHSRGRSSLVPPLLRDTCNLSVLQNHPFLSQPTPGTDSACPLDLQKLRFSLTVLVPRHGDGGYLTFSWSPFVLNSTVQFFLLIYLAVWMRP